MSIGIISIFFRINRVRVQGQLLSIKFK
jgi:hypothetical protein